MTAQTAYRKIQQESVSFFNEAVSNSSTILKNIKTIRGPTKSSDLAPYVYPQIYHNIC
jgi:hypothetical protein